MSDVPFVLRKRPDALLAENAPQLLAALEEAHAFLRSLLNATLDEVHDSLMNNGETVEDRMYDAICKAKGVVTE